VSPNPDELRQHAVELAASVEAMDAYDAAERKQLRYQAHQTQRSRRPKL
jgi:hypothetical protein